MAGIRNNGLAGIMDEEGFKEEADKEIVEEDFDDDAELKLTESDKEKLLAAKKLIEETDFWKKYAGYDYDYALHRAHTGINETLNEQWWGL